MPDYKKSLFQVYTEFARAHLSFDDVEVLYEAGIGRRLQSVDELPSWAPDLRKDIVYRPAARTPWLSEDQRFWAASAFPPKVVLIDRDFGSIKVRAVLVNRINDHGIIRDTTKFTPVYGGFSFRYMRDVTAITRALIKGVEKSRDCYPTSEDLETAKCRALVTDDSELTTHMNEVKNSTLTEFLQPWGLHATFCLAEEGEVFQKDQKRTEQG